MVKHIPLIALGILAVGVLTFVLWPQHKGLTIGVPEIWDRNSDSNVGMPEQLVVGTAVPQADAKGSWPNFLGPNRDAICPDDGVKLATSWPAEGPRILWNRTVGNGHAGVAIYKGRVYLTDYDATLFPDPNNNNQPIGGDIIRCMSLTDGNDIWTYTYPVASVNNHGVSRPVPAVTDKHLVSFGPKCEVYVLDSMTGEKKWSVDLKTKYGAVVPKWYAGQCPLIDGDYTVIAPSGKAGAGVTSKDDVLMFKADLETGEILWEAENTLGSDQTHVSIATMDLYGKKTYVYSGSQGLAAIDAETGEIMWDSKLWFNKIANCATPVPIPDNRLFLSAGYGSGCMMLKINQNGERYEPEVLWTKPEREFGSVQHTPIFDSKEEVIYGIKVSGELVCLQLDGTFRWASGKEKENKYGIGPYLASEQGLIYALDGHGRLDLVRINPNKFERLASAKVLHNKDAWGPMALAGGYLIARDIKQLICIDVSAEGE